jgi:hypothetical protein
MGLDLFSANENHAQMHLGLNDAHWCFCWQGSFKTSQKVAFPGARPISAVISNNSTEVAEKYFWFSFGLPDHSFVHSFIASLIACQDAGGFFCPVLESK